MANICPASSRAEMMAIDIDIASHLGAVSRVVEDRVHDGQAIRVVIASRAYDTDIEDLWDALTNTERLPRWFAPVEGELKPGGGSRRTMPTARLPPAMRQDRFPRHGSSGRR
jgi:hypothetical protein